jgi:polyisoprenoid-binding protein YceI
MTMQKIAQRIAIVSALALAASLSALAQTSNWSIDPAHSTAQFTVRHLGISNVTGNFTKVAGSVVLDEKNAKRILRARISLTWKSIPPWNLNPRRSSPVAGSCK